MTKIRAAWRCLWRATVVGAIGSSAVLFRGALGSLHGRTGEVAWFVIGAVVAGLATLARAWLDHSVTAFGRGSRGSVSETPKPSGV
jgi:hypothetical protein